MPERAARRPVDGVLLLDKPSGPTSNQALQRAKRLFGARKAGHAGTLDPMATGLLPVMFGEATKFAGWLSGAIKTYEATLLLGTTTTTGDLTGEVLGQQSVRVDDGAIESAVARFRGTIDQVPPMFSAIKLGGRPLYELARRGEVVERAARKIQIMDLSILARRGEELDIRVTCSKGTYIRVLAEEIGASLGCGAALKHLRRLAVGPFSVSNATSFETVEGANDAERVRFLLPVEAGVNHLPSIEISLEQAYRIAQGQSITVIHEASEGTIRIYERGTRKFLGIGDISGSVVQPVRLVAHIGMRETGDSLSK